MLADIHMPYVYTVYICTWLLLSDKYNLFWLLIFVPVEFWSLLKQFSSLNFLDNKHAKQKYLKCIMSNL